jgi:hypothetical protein
MESIDPPKEPWFCRVNYPYGAAIFDKEKLFIPNENNRLVSTDDPKISKQYQEFFGPNPLPLGMVLNKCLGYSLEEKTQFVPLHVFYTGHFFGLWELFDENYS